VFYGLSLNSFSPEALFHDQVGTGKDRRKVVRPSRDWKGEKEGCETE